MAKRPTIEERIEALAGLRGLESTTETRDMIIKGLSSKIGLVVAAAAEAAQSQDFSGDEGTRLEDALGSAFKAMAEDGAKRDPLCRAKLAIAETLHARGNLHDDVFATGVTLIQEEPVWGGKEDTAADLRARCGLAFAELYHPDAVNVLATLLSDRERAARAGAAHALGNSGRLEAIPLLRFKALTGDDDLEVFSATLRALLTLDPDSSLEFIAQFLERGDNAAEAAALCLGESRLAAALPILRRWASEPQRAEVGYLALALSRLDEATEFLIAEIESAEDDAAAAAEKALEASAHDAALARRVSAALAKRSAR